MYYYLLMHDVSTACSCHRREDCRIQNFLINILAYSKVENVFIYNLHTGKVLAL